MIFDKYLDDFNTPMVYKKGDILFRLKREGNMIVTYWNEIKPMIIENQQDGKICFTKE